MDSNVRVLIDAKALKDLKKMPKARAAHVLEKIETLESFPEVPNIKRLTHFEPPFRMRVGEYRVLFDVEDDMLTVYRVKHRKESYR